MPVLPAISGVQYDTVNDVLTSAKARLNDEITTLLATGGNILGNGQFSTQQNLNSAWRNMQDCLADRGYAALITETVVAGLPVVAGLDPSIQTWLSWNGFFDGANFFPAIQLPGDFTHPIKMWERWSGQNAEFLNPPMEKILDGLPAWSKTSRIRFWEWRGDAIYMPGSQVVEDLRIRYVRYMPDFADVGNLRWFQQPVPIMRGSDSLSWFLCSEVVGSRGDLPLAQSFRDKGEAALTHIFNLDVKADQRVNVQRHARAGRRRSGLFF